MKPNPSRRDVLRIGAAALATGALAGCATGPDTGDGDAKFPGFIDAHSHVWSSDTERHPIAPWVDKAKMDPPHFTADELLAIARPAGVDRVVLIQHAPYHGYDNSYILGCARQRPGVFSVVAMIDERKTELRARLAAMRDAGARGIRISPMIHADRTPNAAPTRWLEADGMRALWRHAAELGVAVCPLLPAAFLPTLDPMCERNPDTICVIDHFGHIDIADESSVVSLTRLARHRNVLVKVSAFYKFADKRAPYDDLAPMIRRVVDAFGPSRLMWAGDCPYQLQNGNNYADAVALIRDGLGFLSPDDRRAMLRDTAARVFFAA